MTLKIEGVPEVKGTEDMTVAFAEFMTAFSAYRETNDRRLAEIERGRGDVVTEEKLARIDEALDRQKSLLDGLVLKAGRPALGGAADGRRSILEVEHRGAFEAYVRGGTEGQLRALEQKALSAGSGPDGGYLVPTPIEADIGARLATISPIRSIASVRTVSTASYKKPYRVTGPDFGWVGETAARPQTNAPVLAEIAYPTMELYAMPAATQTLLDDSAVDIDAWIADEVETVFAVQEGAAFVTGDGLAKPKGFLAAPTAAESNWSWGNLGYLTTGAAGAFAAANPSDVLIDLIYSLKAGYRQNAAFVMNRKTQAAVRKFKDATGEYLWAPPAGLDGKATLAGFPVVEAEDMPDVGPDSLSIAFGDFRRGYLVVDRAGIRVLRDPYSAKPYVLFYTTKRVGGGVQDFDAIKLLKFGTA